MSYTANIPCCPIHITAVLSEVFLIQNTSPSSPDRSSTGGPLLPLSRVATCHEYSEPKAQVGSLSYNL